MTENWQRGEIVDNRPWPRIGLSLMRDMMNPDSYALGIEIVNDREYVRDQKTGLFIASGAVPLPELALFFQRSPIGHLFKIK